MHPEELNRLRVVLAEKKKSQRWLAKELGVTEHTVSRWCGNHTQPTLKVLYDIAELLKVSVFYLLNENTLEG